ncbi:hypothetical protein ACQR1I_04865 [Bradyrhizobium sp. HKCCYLS2038]|uniref:hypothetical protein n=1 Tax=unclassified Bradyrhizobium TaxID=2631580 RepID=UPI003EBEEF00
MCAHHLVNRLCEPIAFENDFGIDESVRRLASRIKPDLLGLTPLVSMKLTVVVGKVAEDHVSLYCERLFIANGLRPVFIGRFQTFDDRVILIGKWVGLNGQASLFVGAGLAMSRFMIRSAALKLIEGSHDPILWLMPLAGCLPPLFAMGLVRVGRRLSSGDANWILGAIRAALVETPRSAIPTISAGR